MKGKKFAVVMAAAVTLAFCCACDPNSGNPKDPNKAQTEFKLADYENLPAVQFSSVYAVEESGSCKLKMTAPWTDTYTVSFSEKAVSKVELYDAAGKSLVSSAEKFTVNLNEGDIVYANIIPVRNQARITVTAKENKSPLPFEIANAPAPSSFKTTSDDPTVDPLEPAQINYVKREDTLYVYCNAPERVADAPQVVNKCITRQDVSDQSVYFTFEQQTTGLKEENPQFNFKDNGVYYGYRVTNTGTEDLYVTVRNIGWQIDGAGAYLGEKEWIDFYNTAFPLDLSDLNESQMRLFNGYFGFSGEYMVHDFQPTTYRIPAGKYMYVMGGTTTDAFGGFNVDNTANRLTTYSTCANGAVLFDVVGEAEGAYYVYNDVSKVVPGGEGYDTHMGINDPAKYGDEHTGEDVGYVVDNQATWTFNDATPGQMLPVTYTNYYSDNCPSKGEPNTEIPGTTAHKQEGTKWATHLHPQAQHDAVGTDMTAFHTVNQDGERIVVGPNLYDSNGDLPNLGNWMKDYQDLFTFVNQGDSDREITVNLVCSGAVVMLVRDMDGKLIPGTAGYAMRKTDDLLGGVREQGFDKSFHYTVKIPAHSVVQFVVEYNLMANSYGYITHSVELK